MNWIGTILDLAGPVSSLWPYAAGALGLATGGAAFAIPKALPWIVAAAGVIGGGGFGLVEHARAQSLKAEIATAAAQAEKKLRLQRDHDAEVTRGLEDQLAAEIAARKDQTHGTALAIARAPVTDACLHSPAMGALFDGLRHRGAAAGAGAAADPGRAGAAVPR